MKDGCLTPEEMAIALGAPEDDPHRRHLEECTWCQGLAASVDLFQRDEGLPAGADLAEAEDRLEDFLQREILGEGRSSRVVPLAAAPRKKSRRWSGPAAWAAAAVLVATVGLTTVVNRRSEDVGQGILRSGGTDSHFTLLVEAVEGAPEAGVRLAWSGVDGAVRYDVVLLDGHQGEAGRLAAGAETTLTIDRETLTGLRSRPAPWFVRVEARGEDDILARSLPRIISMEGRKK